MTLKEMLSGTTYTEELTVANIVEREVHTSFKSTVYHDVAGMLGYSYRPFYKYRLKDYRDREVVLCGGSGIEQLKEGDKITLGIIVGGLFPNGDFVSIDGKKMHYKSVTLSC